MNKVTYINECPNGGWKYFTNEIENRKEFNNFLKLLRDNKCCVAFTATNNKGCTFTYTK
jgi:hypothetical protein